MSVVVEVVVPASDFGLGRSLQSAGDGVRFELERMVPTTDRIIPFFWAHNADAGALETMLLEDETIHDVTLLDELDDQALFRVDWPADINGLVQTSNEYGATVLEAVGTTERWEFQFRFPDEADIAAFSADCEQAGVTLDLKRLYHPDKPELDTSGLTPTQRETLLTALEEGYFAIPRDITTEELAGRFGISDQATSERLRRAQTTVFTTLLIGDDADFETVENSGRG
ncbi:helix-turn-helix domain-containing protein [Halococcus sediminicola]|uniref:helix-turn-helix domain-containing protein n=1 Tax=Halococcus sediminicola TaxID=1264579 RepID=UPI000679D59D|nr:helix-turn-helix domain-containing protein [Halococcus sediminicola]